MWVENTATAAALEAATEGFKGAAIADLCLVGNAYHPTDPKAVLQHPKAGRPERFGKRHLDLPTLRQRCKSTVRFGFIGDCKREGEAFEGRLFGATAVRRHHHCLADAEAGMHDFVFIAGRYHAWRGRF